MSDKKTNNNHDIKTGIDQGEGILKKGGYNPPPRNQDLKPEYTPPPPPPPPPPKKE